jgi:hypothetical protein
MNSQLSAMGLVLQKPSAFCSVVGGARQHFESLHGIVPGLFVVRVAKFRRPLGAFHQQLSRHRDIATAKHNI